MDILKQNEIKESLQILNREELVVIIKEAQNLIDEKDRRVRSPSPSTSPSPQHRVDRDRRVRSPSPSPQHRPHGVDWVTQKYHSFMRAPSDAEKAENRYLVDEWQHRNSVLPPGARSGGSKKHKKKLTKKHKNK